MIIKNYIPGLPCIPYRGGVGAYEGIVLHSTDNNGDSALGERNFESRTFQKAFVHSFSDKLMTLEVADPNYICYGAGNVANQRFLSAELCQVLNDGSREAQYAFRESYANWIEYAATKLYDRKLGVLGAAPDGTGTVWQHAQVSRFLGGTNHSDPMPYLETWGVTWTKVLDDIYDKYKELEELDELKKMVAELALRTEALEKGCMKTAAPQWFVDEFGSADLNGLIHDPMGDENFWRCIAVGLRVK